MSQYIETTRMLRRLLDLVEREDSASATGATFAELELARKADEPEKLGELIQFLEGAHEVDALPRPETARGPAQILNFDGFQKRRPPTPQIEIADHVEFGRIVAAWAADPGSRPTTVAGLAEQLRGVAKVPASLQRVAFAQGDAETVVINLPAPDALQDALDDAADPQATAQPPIPQFYADLFRPGLGPVLTPTDTLLARLGERSLSLSR